MAPRYAPDKAARTRHDRSLETDGPGDSEAQFDCRRWRPPVPVVNTRATQ